MKKNKNETLIGILFIIAAVASIIGLILYEPILQQENYLIEGAKNSNKIILGALFELILVSSAVGTGIMFFPFLKKHNENFALGYLSFRMLEAIFILVGIISILALLSVSQHYTVNNLQEETSYIISGILLKSIHTWTFMLGPNFMLGINTFLYSYILFRFSLVPKKLSILGIISSVLIFLAAILEMFGVIKQISTPGFLLAFPIFLYEMLLAIRLIVKGFEIE